MARWLLKNTKISVTLSDGSGEPKQYTITLASMPNVKNAEATIRAYLDGTETVYDQTVLLNGSPVSIDVKRQRNRP